jgi:hypothetical protein
MKKRGCSEKRICEISRASAPNKGDARNFAVRGRTNRSLLKSATHERSVGPREAMVSIPQLPTISARHSACCCLPPPPICAAAFTNGDETK